MSERERENERHEIKKNQKKNLTENDLVLFKKKVVFLFSQ